MHALMKLEEPEADGSQDMGPIEHFTFLSILVKGTGTGYISCQFADSKEIVLHSKYGIVFTLGHGESKYMAL